MLLKSDSRLPRTTALRSQLQELTLQLLCRSNDRGAERYHNHVRNMAGNSTATERLEDDSRELSTYGCEVKGVFFLTQTIRVLGCSNYELSRHVSIPSNVIHCASLSLRVSLRDLNQVYIMFGQNGTKRSTCCNPYHTSTLIIQIIYIV